MTLNKERKVYAAVLALGVAVLAADRLLVASGGAGSAEDEYAVRQDEQSPVPEAEMLDAGEVAQADRAICGRLLATAERVGVTPGESGDAFVVPAAWSPSDPEIDEAPDPGDVPEFARRYRLAAVMAGRDGRGFATLHGPAGSRTTLHVGQTVEGYRLVEVQGRDGRWAVFEGPEGRIRLTIDEPLGRAAENTPARPDNADDPGGG